MNKQQWYTLKNKIRHPICFVDKARFMWKSMKPVEFCENITGKKVTQEILDGAKNIYYQDDQRVSLYILTRLLKPEKVVETGVAKGASTQAILKAMKDNNFGHLWSIELQVEGYCTDGQVHMSETTAEFVSDDLKDRWTLVLGDSKIELPKLLKKIGRVNLFIHDSLHTYEHMLMEFKAALPYSNIIFSDDIFWNHAFMEACNGRRYYILNNGQQGAMICQPGL